VIHFTVPERAHVKLTVENSYNTVMAVLVDGEMNGGTYQVSYDPSNLAEGIYFYIVEVSGIDDTTSYKITRHLLLIK
jgi:hypothetical protein